METSKSINLEEKIRRTGSDKWICAWCGRIYNIIERKEEIINENLPLAAVYECSNNCWVKETSSYEYA